MAKTSRFLGKLRGKTPAAAQDSDPLDPDLQNFLTDEEGEELSGISGPGYLSQVADHFKAAEDGNPPPDPDAHRRETPEAAAAPEHRTAFHKIINEMWGQPEIADFMAVRLAQYMDLESAEKTDNGFKIKTHDGLTLKWGLLQAPDGRHYEAITSPKRHFDQDTADSIITLAMLHGWRSIKVHGKEAHKEMMWLSVQRHAMIEQEEIERLKAAKELPEDYEYTPPVVSNFRPAEDSAVYQQWLKEKAEWEARRANKTIDADTPAVTEADDTPPEPAPDVDAKIDAETPTSQTQSPAKPEDVAPETAQPADEKPAADKPAAKDPSAQDNPASAPKTAPKKKAAAAKTGADETGTDETGTDEIDDGIQAKNPAFEAQHPRDKDGHFVSKVTGKHAPLKKRVRGEVSGQFNAKSPRGKKPAAAKKGPAENRRNDGKSAPPPP